MTVTTPWVFDPLPLFGFDVIMADPPWLFEMRSEVGENKSAQFQYRCMPTDAIAALPVNQLARRDCWLWLWATFPMIDHGLRVLRAWGFTYVTGGAWVKRGASGKLAMGPGYVFRGNAELVLIGRIGTPQIRSRGVRNIIEGPRRRHSEKPDEAYAAAEALFGPAFRADLFSRRSRPGWTAWGAETGKFDGPEPELEPKPEPAQRPPKPPRFEHPDQVSLLEGTLA